MIAAWVWPTLKYLQAKRLKHLLLGIALIGVVLGGASAHAQDRAVVEGVRLSAAGPVTRVVFDLSAPVEHSVFMLREPDRLVIDFNGAQVNDELDLFAFPTSAVKSIRHAQRNGDDLRVVLDLKSAVQPRSFLLKADRQQGLGDRLVVDLHNAQTANELKPLISTQDTPQRLREVVVAIDAGHGGKDPGAVGRRGTQEKAVVLAVAKELQSLITRERGMRAVMIRSTDEFVELRERIKKAKDENADIFISIHADASPDKRARGSSVYILSENGASSEEARRLAELENSAFTIGDVDLSNKDKLLATVLLDLSTSATIERSMSLGGGVLNEMQTLGHMRSKHVEEAGFAVLKSLDIPSILVETAFITNASEEKRLSAKSHQRKLAQAMLRGIRAYFSDNAPEGTLLTQRNGGAQAQADTYVIQRGDTLSEIAQQYRISVGALRAANGLEGDRLKVGQTLSIPLDG